MKNDWPQIMSKSLSARQRALAPLYHLVWTDFGHRHGEGYVFRIDMMNLKNGKRI
jgi:hypothetical protein